MKTIDKKLVLCDLDNHLYCWVSYFAPATKASLQKVSEMIDVPYKQLCKEHKQILLNYDSVEYPFAIQQLPSVISYYNSDLEQILKCSEAAKSIFKLASYPYLKPFPNVLKTLAKIREQGHTLVVLSDAPIQPACWRLHKLGILNYFDMICGLQNPMIPVINNDVYVTQRTLFKHLDQWKYGFLGKVREFPNEYRKPNLKGFKNILIDLGIDSSYNKEDIIMSGDHVFKDVKLGLDASITSVWAKYGVEVDQEHFKILKEVAPAEFIHKGVNLKGDFPQADLVMTDFSQILTLLD